MSDCRHDVYTRGTPGVGHDGKNLLGFLLGLALVQSMGCIPQYNARPPFPTAEEIAATPSLNYPTGGADRMSILSRNWPRESARCLKVRAAMQREADGIDAKNKAIGSIFIGITAALAAASGLYTSLAKNPDPTVSALLAFGASGTTVPSFFFLGSDDREKLVRSRIDAIDAKRSSWEDAWKTFQAADTQVSTTRDALTAATGIRDALKCPTPPVTDECKTAIATVAEAQKAATAAAAKWYAASDAASQAADALDQACQ